MNPRKQYEKEHPERVGETDKVFAESLYIEWLEVKVIAVQNDVSKSLPSEPEKCVSKTADEFVDTYEVINNEYPPQFEYRWNKEKVKRMLTEWEKKRGNVC